MYREKGIVEVPRYDDSGMSDNHDAVDVSRTSTGRPRRACIMLRSRVASSRTL